MIEFWKDMLYTLEVPHEFIQAFEKAYYNDLYRRTTKKSKKNNRPNTRGNKDRPAIGVPKRTGRIKRATHR